MQKRREFLIVFFVILSGVIIHLLANYSSVFSISNQNGKPQKISPSLPPPPPPVVKPTMPQPEPSRFLVETDEEELANVEASLPNGNKILIYPLTVAKERAALWHFDIDDDGVDEKIVLYTEHTPTLEDGALSLIMSVLSKDNDKFVIRASTLIKGSVLFDVNFDGTTTPLIVSDVTGSGHKDIVVASGVGASVGGNLQVFSIEGTSLQQIASVAGHFFQIDRSIKGTVITARWKDEIQSRRYKWDGQNFQLIGNGGTN